MPTYEANGVRIKNMRATLAALEEIGTPRDAIKEANFKAATIVADEARTLAPISRTKYKPGGALKRSIRANKALTKATVRAGGARVPYANPIHWGWFYDRKNFVYKNIKPNPFLVKAMGYTRDEVVKTYYENINKLMNKAASEQRTRTD